MGLEIFFEMCINDEKLQGALAKLSSSFESPIVEKLRVFNPYSSLKKKAEDSSFSNMMEKEVLVPSLSNINRHISPEPKGRELVIDGFFVAKNAYETVTLVQSRSKSDCYNKLVWHSNISRREDGYYNGTDGKCINDKLFSAVEKSLQIFKPKFALLDDISGEITKCWFEYHSDPYMFCLEPEIEFDARHNFTGSYKNEKTLNAKLAEIKKALPREKLIELLKKHSDKIFINMDGGVGVFRNLSGRASPGSYGSEVYPRFFIRKAVRAAGVSLDDGAPEKSAKEVGLQ